MRRGRVIIVTSLVFTSCFAHAGDMGAMQGWSGNTKPVIELITGVASMNARNQSVTFSGVDDNNFAYRQQGNSNATGFVGGFLGLEYPLPYPKWFVQGGVEYAYFGQTRFNGTNTVGIEPATTTLYNDHYYFQTQQVLATAKLFTTTELPLGNHPVFYPYFSVGIGAAFNDVNEFNVSTSEVGSVNLTPLFASASQTNFSYSLGVGVETQVNDHARVGLGYRFSNFGQASLGAGQVVLNDYHASVPFTLTMPSAYANQFVIQLSYLT